VKLRAVIFDLDQTLVDSQSLEPRRKRKAWADVYRDIPTICAYEGISELLTNLRGRGIRLAVVTSTPRPYCSKMLAACGLSFDAAICYHDTKRKKPHPDPMLLALKKLGNLEARTVVAVGDAPHDITSARKAGMYAIGALWGSADHGAITAERPDAVVHSVAELQNMLNRFD
jgi:HAD superfamily hydrolase (TIGR01662 family)